MFKFLRKYNKWLLAVFGVLLMITFLIPQAFDQWSQNAAAGTGTIATVGDGEKVSAAEWSQYQRDLEILQRLRRTNANAARTLALPGLGFIDDPAQWYLLVREAEAADLIPTLQMTDSNTDAIGEMLMAAQERNPEVMLRTLARFQGVSQLLMLYETGGLYSDRRLRSEAARLLHTVMTRLVMIEPDAETSDLQPTDEEIEKQMRAYADKLPGEGDFGFGYKLPNRVKIEWLKIAADEIRAQFEQSEAMDPVRQRLHWRKNPNKTLPAYPTDAGASAVPPEVREDLLKQLTRERLDEIARNAADTLRLPQRGLVEAEGYFVLPDDWERKAPSFPQLAEGLRAKFKISLPEYESRGDQWLTIDELAELPGIGPASTTKFGNAPIAFMDLVKAAKEFEGNSTVIFQKGIASPPLRDAEDNLYFVRIVDTDPSRPPASINEVREKVVKDLRRKAGYESLKQRLGEIEAQARADGLLSTALAHETIVHPQTPVYMWNESWVSAMAQYNMPMSFQPSNLPVVGGERSVIESIIDHALALPPEAAIDALPADQKIFVVPSDDHLALVVTEIVSQRPLTQESFERLAQAGALQQLLAAVESGEADREPNASMFGGAATPAEETEPTGVARAFSFDTLSRRHGFALKREDGDDASGSDAAVDDDAVQPPAAPAAAG